MFDDFFAQFGGVGVEKIGVYDRFFLSFKKSVFATVCVVDQVVGQDECAGFKAVIDADDGGNGDDVFRTYGMLSSGSLVRLLPPMMANMFSVPLCVCKEKQRSSENPYPLSDDLFVLLLVFVKTAVEISIHTFAQQDQGYGGKRQAGEHADKAH